MEKDIIYIDTEDDITSIIGKIKASKDKIIALVPPKRTGVLQSAINLRLLQQAAKGDAKRLVLITGDQALMSLASLAKIPVAKNLQSKPELAEINAIEVDDGDDIIDGSEIPVGELIKITDNSSDKKIAEDLRELDIESDSPKKIKRGDDISEINIELKDVADDKTKRKIPNSAEFRKKLILGTTGSLLVIGFLVWAIVFSPGAKVIISAKTEVAPVSLSLTLGEATDVDKNIIQTITKTITEEASIDITPTGTKEVGKKATGTLTLANGSSSVYTYTIPAGTVITRSGKNFVTNETVTVPVAELQDGDINPGTIDVGITASQVGSDFNLTAGAYTSPITGITATGIATSGGESHTAKVVTKDDIETAKQKLDKQLKTAKQNKLKTQFANGEIVILDSFTSDYSKLTLTPALDEEVTGATAKFSGTATFTMTALPKADVELFLKKSINNQIDNKDQQQIFDNGISKVKASDYAKNETKSSVNIATSGQIGPKIDNDKIKEMVKGKNYGDAQNAVEKLTGVSGVDIKFSYLWVIQIPNDPSKITVELKVEQ